MDVCGVDVWGWMCVCVWGVCVVVDVSVWGVDVCLGGCVGVDVCGVDLCGWICVGCMCVGGCVCGGCMWGVCVEVDVWGWM